MVNTPEMQCAAAVAREAGELLLQYNGPELEREKKSEDVHDIVTAADKASEALVIERLQEAFPDYSILGEENGWIGDKESERKWIVDPLDGTYNFSNGIHHYGVMISLIEGEEVVGAAVYSPELDLLAVGQRGHGVFLNGERVDRFQEVPLEEAEVKCSHWADYPHRVHITEIESAMQEMGKNPEGPMASAAVVLGLLSGEYDAWTAHAWFPWDFSPYLVLCEEAGMRVTTLDNEPLTWRREDQSILVAAPELHTKLRSYIE